MKRICLICALLTAAALVCAGCGKQSAFDPQPVEPSDSLTQTVGADASEDESQTLPSEETDADTTGKSAGTTAEADTSATKVGETTTKAGETTTRAGASTTKAGETTAKSGTSATKAGETTTKPDTSATKAGETTTKTGASATKAGETTTKTGTASTTRSGSADVTQPAKGNAVSGKLSYLNPADKKTSSLSSRDLERYGITGSKASEILANPDAWAVYTIRIDFRNDESVPITLYYLDVTNNGTGDVFVCGDFSAEIGLGPGSSENEVFYLLAKSGDAESTVLNKVGKLNMRVQYAATPEDDDTTPNFVYSKVN